MERIRLHDKEFRLFVRENEIDRVITEMAGKMNRDLKDDTPLFLCILNGAFMFASDLLKRISIPGTEISFVKVASYEGTGSTGQVRELIGLNEDIGGRTVVVVEDIIDSGRSMAHLLEYLKEKKAGRVVVAALFHKPKAAVVPVRIDYRGMELENDFIVGRGLDYDGLGRNYPDLYILDRNLFLNY